MLLNIDQSNMHEIIIILLIQIMERNFCFTNFKTDYFWFIHACRERQKRPCKCYSMLQVGLEQIYTTTFSHNLTLTRYLLSPHVKLIHLSFQISKHKLVNLVDANIRDGFNRQIIFDRWCREFLWLSTVLICQAKQHQKSYLISRFSTMQVWVNIWSTLLLFLESTLTYQKSHLKKLEKVLP